MAKKALVNKANRKPKFAVRAYTRCTKCGRPRAVYRKFGLCRICLREMAHAGELPGVQKSSWQRDTGLNTMTMTDPIADFLTRLRNANSAYHDEVSLPHSKIKANIAEILKSEGYIADYHTEDARVGKALVIQLKYGPSRERSI